MRSDDLTGARVYLAGPRLCLDPAGYAAVTTALLELGLIARPVPEAFELAAAALRAAGAEVLSPWEQPWWRGEDVPAGELRAARDAHAVAPAQADLVLVLDGWIDVPGAVDAAVLGARTAGVPVSPVAEALAVTGSGAALRRRAS